ncbi:NTP transferase domain-containing protein [Denitratisoma oestradiolicum]|uniref:MoaB/Mog domain-containing protein n=1 Tax=Denitratisoma oestradiolicum TaxID=311182 RepID=A0A6S6XTF2_9PROT|nr:molybdopterin-binding/glycosyltransferase family 2 protein [Denitratisoma oestradiolicum]TWO80206.1 hypothetical protein CBW56_10320 [Denitratisoma oestradiolicum]CAB1369285.1 conserved protein of unknown function [Denitratisoma oestradiolicum]
MIFGDFALEQAEGLRLAHTLKRPGLSLRKGRVLSAADIAALAAAGIRRVTGARLGADELDEDAAAAAVAGMLAGDSLAPREAYTGRCNLHAQAAGVLVVDRERIDALNRLDEAITVGTLVPHALVRPGQVVATVKVIPFAISAHLLAAWRCIIDGRPPLGLAALMPHRVALILSRGDATPERLLDRTVTVTAGRLAGLGSTLDMELRCAHTQDALTEAIGHALKAGCELVLISGATVTKDRGDVVPAAIEAAGGRIEHFGMPVEPGNMLLLGRVGAVPVVNLPGCARSRRRNGLDWVLQRILAGLPLGSQDIMDMGVGGLIRSPFAADEVESDSDGPPAPAAAAGPRIAALVLAAGRSSRMGERNKLLCPVAGQPMVRRVVEAALGSRCAQVMVVTGHQAEQVETALAGCPVSRVFNPDYAEGMASSLRAGLQALPRDTEAVLVVLADMPWISAAHLDRLIATFDPARPAILVPEREGRRGNPLLWPRAYFDEMSQLQGDVGARLLLERHADSVRAVRFDTDAIFADVDTPQALAETREP